MHCLVTGVAGFVGSHLTERLLADGHTVRGIDSFTDYYPRSIKENNLKGALASDRFTFIEADILHTTTLHLLSDVDWVFHQAAQAGVRASWGQEFEHYVDYNVLATQRLLEAAVHMKGLQRFVYASSSSVYGDIDALPVTEDATPHPVSPYGVTKLAAEHLCTLYNRVFGVPTVSLRYFTVYGPRQRPDMAFHRFCKAIIEGQPLRIYGDGRQTRDFTYISDIVEANVRSATSDLAIGEVMNIAGGSRVTVRRVVELLQEISGAPVHISFDETQPGDVCHTFADVTLAEKTLGYTPIVSLQEGLSHEFHAMQALYSTAVLS